MTGRSSVLREARRRVSGRVLLLFLGGNLLLLVAAVLGLFVPDSHAWQVLLSLLLVIGLACGVLLFNSNVLRQLRTQTPTVSLWKGALLLSFWIVLGVLSMYCEGLANEGIATRAGYWNSQMTAGMRHWFTYDRFIALQQFFISAVRWVLVPALLLPFAMETSGFGIEKSPIRRAARILFSPIHWLSSLGALGITAWLVPALAVWHPSHSVTGETVSAALRLGIAALLAAFSVLALLAVDAELLGRSQLSQTDTAE